MGTRNVVRRGYFSYFDKKDFLFADGIRKNVTNIAKYTAMFSRIADNNSYYNFYTIRNNERLDSISKRLYNTTEFYWTIPILNSHIVNLWSDLGKDNNDFNRFMEAKYPGFAVLAKTETPVIYSKFEIGDRAQVVIGDTVHYDDLVILDLFATENYLQVQFPPEIDVTDIDLGFSTDPKLVSLDTGATFDIASIIPMTDAPAYYQDDDGNRIIAIKPGGVIPTQFSVTWREVEERKNEADLSIKVLKPERIHEIVKLFDKEMRRLNVRR